MTPRHFIGYVSLCLATIALAIGFIAWTRCGWPSPEIDVEVDRFVPSRPVCSGWAAVLIDALRRGTTLCQATAP